MIEGSGADGGIVAKNDALDALDDAHADNETGAYCYVRTPGRERADFKKWRIGIECPRDSLSDRHLISFGKTLESFGAATSRCLGV